MNRLTNTEPEKPASVFLFYILLLLFDAMCKCLLVCLCTTYVPGALRGRKRVSEFLDLVLKVVVSPYVGAENQI